MNTPNERGHPLAQGGIVSVLLLTAVLVSPTLGVDEGWKAGDSGESAIDVKVYKKWDANWFHYKTEPCPLYAHAHDYDYRYTPTTGWTLMPSDWLDPAKCTWWGSGVPYTSGRWNTWNRATLGPTGVSGDLITYWVDDYSSSPTPIYPGQIVNDCGPKHDGVTLYAYEAVAYLNCTTHSGSPSTGDIHEYTGSNQEIFTAFNHSELIAATNGAVVNIDRYATATWRLETSPAVATLDSSGQLKTDIAVASSGQMKTVVYDEDDDASAITVGVSLTGGAGWGASVGISIPLTDSVEGSAGMGFAFSSDLLGDDKWDEIEESSSEYWGWSLPATTTVTYGYGSSATFRGGKNSETKAKALLKGEGSCRELPECQAYAKISTNASVGDGGVTYDVHVPTYEPGSGFQRNPNYVDPP